MSKTAAAVPEVRAPDAPWADLLQWQLDWAAQVLAMQSSWLTSWTSLFDDKPNPAWPTPDQWLSWLVWHNGTEQLA